MGYDSNKLDGEGKFWISIAAIAMFGAVAFTSICLSHCNIKHTTMVEAGYEQVTVIGTNTIIWQKVKEK